MGGAGFVALDVETANADLASICQIGLALFDGPRLLDEWKTLVDPRDWFDSINISIHGIDECAVEGAPTFAEVANRLCDVLHQQIVVSHAPFDRVAVARACEAANVVPPLCHWLDSACVARRAWPEVAHRGYGLQNICARIGYSYRAHDALEDAKAAAAVLNAAIAETSLDLVGWLDRVTKPITPGSGHIAMEGRADGPLCGDVLVFTGALSVPRGEAAALASQIGCEVAQGVTHRTTILVVGDQDARRLNGHDKSGKHRKAEELIAKGQRIRVLTESDFCRLVEECGGEVRHT
jgi:DNA polymerase-3 subunit epsilon